MTRRVADVRRRIGPVIGTPRAYRSVNGCQPILSGAHGFGPWCWDGLVRANRVVFLNNQRCVSTQGDRLFHRLDLDGNVDGNDALGFALKVR